MLPRIRNYADYAFRRLNLDAKEEAIAEVTAGCYVALVRLAERGKLESAFPSVLVRYAVRHFHAGRRVGSSSRSDDVMSATAQRRHDFSIKSLDILDDHESIRSPRSNADYRQRVTELAALRSDLSTWLRQLPTRRRRIAEALARGAVPAEVARAFHLSLSRISQLRRKWLAEWLTFRDKT